MAPTPFSISRSVQINAPVSLIQPLVVDFRQWRAWSPWEGADADMERRYDGPASGVGATYRWTGNRRAGAGVMSIDAVEPGRLVRIGLAFSRPFAATNTVTFAFDDSSDADTTRVEWTMTGQRAGSMKLFARLLPMDRLVGRDFEKGLAALKERAEAAVSR